MKEQEHSGARDGHKEAGKTQGGDVTALPEIGEYAEADDGAANPHEDGGQRAALVLAGNDRLGDQAYNRAKANPDQEIMREQLNVFGHVSAILGIWLNAGLSAKSVSPIGTSIGRRGRAA